MGRSKMTSLPPLAICLLLSPNSQVSGKPSPKHFLIETKEMAKKHSDYISDINNHGHVSSIIDGSHNVGKDYVSDVNNGGTIGGVSDLSVNVGKDYMAVSPGTSNPNHYWG